MEHYTPNEEHDGPWATLLGYMAERGAWRLRTHHRGREVTLDTLLGRLQARDPALFEALRAAQGAPLFAALDRVDDDVCIESVPPVLTNASRTLATAGTLSSHAFELVAASLDAGRNVLCTGPYSAAWPVMAAWLETGHSPAVWSRTGAASRRWQRLSHVEQQATWGADRLGVFGRTPKDVARACRRASHVVAHVEGHSLERALMRFEQAVGKSGALGVLSALDVVVVTSLDADRKPQVDGIYEIVMGESAYRPVPLFVRHRDRHQRASGTLVAVGLPTFVDAIARVGRDGLLEEVAAAAGIALPLGAVHDAAAQQAAEALRPGELERRVAAHAGHAPPDAQGPFSQQAAMMLQAPRTSPHAPGRPRGPQAGVRPQSAAPRKPAAPGAHRAAPLSPGWELDQLEMADLSGPLPFPEDEPKGDESGHESGDIDAAALAATFGLAPPRAPRGMAAEAAQPMAPRPTADGQAPSFLDALAKTSRMTQPPEDALEASSPRPHLVTDEPTLAQQPPRDEDERAAQPRHDDPHES